MQLTNALALLTAATLLSSLPAPAAASRLSPFEAHYSVARNGKTQGEAVLQLARVPGTSDRWELSMTVQANRGLAGLVGFREQEVSQLQDAGDGWRLLSYRRERDAALSSRGEAAEFDWEQGSARVKLDKSTLDVALEPGTVDPSSLFLRIAADLLAGRSPGTYPVLRKGKLEQWPFKVLRVETLDGRETAVVERVRDHDRRKTISWLAADLGYLPVRMEQIEKNDTLVLSLVSMER